MSGLLILGTITLILICAGALEYFLHRRNLLRIPIRIHVNGTRGKSSVTRLISAGLREAGVPTCAKTTGTLPRIIMPNGREFPVFRPAGPNVIEQLRIVAAASSAGAKVLVLECMALQPHLQSLSELKMVKATHGIITNARPDHLDVMGPGEQDVALALAGMVPVNGVLYSCERKSLPLLEKAAADRKTRLVPIQVDGDDAINAGDLDGFGHVEIGENVALALRVCQDLGVDREVALRGMWKSPPDQGAMQDYRVNFFGRRLVFVNGFAANDPESTSKVWSMALQRWPELRHRIAIFNCRADRPDRSIQLGKACVNWPQADHYLLMGSGTYFFAKAAVKAGMDSGRIVFAEGGQVPDIVESIVGLAGPDALLMGMGNIGGHGVELVRYFSNRSTFGSDWSNAAEVMEC